MTRQSKCKEKQTHLCNERTQLLPITIERLYYGDFVLAREGVKEY